MDTDLDVDPTDRPRTVRPADERELSDLEQDTTHIDQAHSEEQTYRETITGIKSFMGWNTSLMCIKVPQIEMISPFAGSLLQQPVGKISVNMPTDDWLCKKLDKLNLTVVKGYPSRNSDAGRLQHDQYMKTPNFTVSGMVYIPVDLVQGALWFSESISLQKKVFTFSESVKFRLL